MLGDEFSAPDSPSFEAAEAPATILKDASARITSDAALLRLLQAVAQTGYRFITPTPLTHQRVLAHRRAAPAVSLRDILGWSLPFHPTVLPRDVLSLMQQAGVLARCGDLFKSTVRVSSIDDDLFLHAAYPTQQDNSVFFGPDTYRFARLIRQTLRDCSIVSSGQPLRLLDVGCGSGAGAVAAARALASTAAESPEALQLTMNDINPLALQYAQVNAQLAGLPVELALGDALSAATGQFDLIISNPPYMYDAAQRAYRHGGERLGRALSVRIAQEALGRLAPGGQLLLYTGVAMVDGIDFFRAELLPLLDDADCTWSYTEIDPDVFGEELEQPAYDQVDRIAAVALVATRRRGRL